MTWHRTSKQGITSMNRYKWFFHPVFIFILSIVALAASFVLYIYWYIEVSAGFSAVIKRHHLDAGQFFEIKTWVVILVLSILLGLIMLGVFIIFAYNQKTWQLYRMQKNFINNFTHELKTPVTSLKLYLDTFLKYDISREDQIRYIGYMIQDTVRILDNINRILNLARIESGSFQKEFVELDLVWTVQEFLRNNADLFLNSEIKIYNHLGKGLYYPISSPLFDMLLMNIITNAIKYNESAIPKIDIHFLSRKNMLQIRFEDNGIGIEKSELKKIFRMFYQVGQSDNMTAKGSGLGLYMVRQIARIHNGTITVESEGRGKGAVFTLTLPLRVKVK
jgi:two-component system, OmpR family, phosphate regulon sensor histidine kinase PhoR